MEELIVYIREKQGKLYIIDVLEIIRKGRRIGSTCSSEEVIERVILRSRYSQDIYDYQKVFEKMFRGKPLPFRLNWDNFVDFVLGEVIGEILRNCEKESLSFQISTKERELIQELIKYQFYQDIGSVQGASKSEIELYYQKHEAYISHIASVLVGLERSYHTLYNMVEEG